MKKLILLLLASCLPLMLVASPADEAAIKKVIQGAYIDGLQNLGDIQTIRDGFHPDFEMLILNNGQLQRLDIGTWIGRVEQRKQHPGSTIPGITGKFLDVDIAGTVALVKLELYHEGNKLFTDYLSLYKFGDDWKIVSKVFYRHGG